jgi:hypothetical protein
MCIGEEHSTLAGFALGASSRGRLLVRAKLAVKDARQCAWLGKERMAGIARQARAMLDQPLDTRSRAAQRRKIGAPSVACALRVHAKKIEGMADGHAQTLAFNAAKANIGASLRQG